MKTESSNPTLSLTLFAVPKAFKGHTGIIQRNAIESWTRLNPKPEILLLGNDSGIAETARELGIKHIPNIECNERGTPLINSIFEQAELHSTSDYMAYINSDNILLNNFSDSLKNLGENLQQAGLEKFFLSSQRREIKRKTPLEFSKTDWRKDIEKEVARQRMWDTKLAIELFLYPRGLFDEIPPFAIGRPGWDPWMVWKAKENHAAIIDASDAFEVIHQMHDYTHLTGGWTEAWWGTEAKKNQVLANNNKMSLLTSTHTMQPSGTIVPGFLPEKITGETMVQSRIERGFDALFQDNYPSALDYLNNATLRKGNRYLPSVNLARVLCLIELDRLQEAKESIRSELQLSIRHNAIDVTEAKSGFTQASMFHQEGINLLDKAENIYSQTIEHLIDNQSLRATILCRMGEISLKKGAHSKAKKYYQEALSVDPTCKEAQVYLHPEYKPLHILISQENLTLPGFLTIEQTCSDHLLWDHFFTQRTIDHLVLHIDPTNPPAELGPLVVNIRNHMNSVGVVEFIFGYRQEDDTLYSIYLPRKFSTNTISELGQFLTASQGSKNTLDVYLSLGLEMEQKGMTTGALEIYANLSTLNHLQQNTVMMACIHQGLLLRKQGQNDAAETCFKNAEKIDPDHALPKIFILDGQQPLNVVLSTQNRIPGEWTPISIDPYESEPWTFYFPDRRINKLAFCPPLIVPGKPLDHLARNIAAHLDPQGTLEILPPDSDANRLPAAIDDKEIRELISLSQKLRQNGLARPAVTLLQHLAGLSNNSPTTASEILCELGEMQLRHDRDNAFSCFQKALQFVPNNFKAQFHLRRRSEPICIILSDQGRESLQDSAIYISLSDDLDRNELKLLAEPGIDSIHLHIHTSQVSPTRWSSAYSILQNHLKPEAQVKFYVYDNKGRKYDIPGSFHSGCNQFKEDPEYEEKLLPLLQITAKMIDTGFGENAKGILPILQKLKDIDPQLCSVLFSKFGELAYQEGKRNQSIELFMKSLEIDPNNLKVKICLVPEERPLNIHLSPNEMKRNDYITAPFDIEDNELWYYYFNERKIRHLVFSFPEQGMRNPKLLAKMLWNYLEEDGDITFPNESNEYWNKNKEILILNMRGYGFIVEDRNNHILCAKKEENMTTDLLSTENILPPEVNRRRVGSPDEDTFIASGKRIFSAIESELLKHLETIDHSQKILDFGSGAGRVAITFMQKYPIKLFCSDIDRTAINFLAENYPNCVALNTQFSPPLPFADNFFDCIYSVSIWTHLPADLQIEWLHEMKRIVKKDGLVLITTGGRKALSVAKEQKHNIAWLEVTEEDLKSQGMIFKEYAGIKKHPENFPGVKGKYGLTMHDPDYIREQWGKIFTVIDINPGCIDNLQDLVVMKKDNEGKGC